MIRSKTWERIGSDIEPFIDDSIIGNEKMAHILDEFSEEDSLDYVVAALSERIALLTELIPLKLESLTGAKRESLRKAIEVISELVD